MSCTFARCWRSLSVQNSAPVFALLAVLGSANVPLCAQLATRADQNIPRYAIQNASSLILAHDGVARLYHSEAGVLGAEFLGGVHKSFGLSPDSRSFLYLKADAGFPTFQLFIHDIETGAATRVGPAAVHHAAWSPDGRMVAYNWLDATGQFHVSIYSLATRQNVEIGAGRLKTEYLEWAPDSSELLYLSVTPRDSDAFETSQWDSTLHRYSLRQGSTAQIPGVQWAQYNLGQLVVAGNPAPPQYRSIPNPQQQNIERFLIHNGQIYANLQRKGKEVVSLWDAATSSYQTVTPGRVLASSSGGVLIRDFAALGVEYKVLPAGRAQPIALASLAAGNQAAAPGVNWRLPFYGRAGMVQGGSAYSDGSCDGSVCQVVAHIARLSYALDFQQVSESNDGNQHILAVEAGTVVSITNNVACSSNSGCTVSADGYSPTCNDPNSGAANYVAIAHIDGSYSFYAHLKSGSVQVHPGQTVSQGTYLADQGHTGSANAINHYRTCGDHVHFQRQTGPAVWAQAIPTDFEDTPCLLSCNTNYPSKNLELAPAPSLSAMQPSAGSPASVVAVTFTGSDFLYGSTLTVNGAGVTPGTLLVNSATQATATLLVGSGAALGFRDVTVTTPRGVSIPLPFNVSGPVTVTLASQPAGITLTADGQTCVAPCTLQWMSGTVHTITAPAAVPRATGTRSAWKTWSDAGALSHSVTAPTSAATYTASFGLQYTLTTLASPAGAGAMTPATGWVDAGVPVPVSASANAGFTFSSFSGALAGATMPQSLTLTGPASVTANFTSIYSLSRASLSFGATVGGTARTAAQEFTVAGSPGISNWTASSDSAWLSVAPTPGQRSGRFTVSIVPAFVPPSGAYTGHITITAAGAYSGSLVTTCTLSVNSVTAAPFGSLDTPTEGATGLAGNIAVTGWALDDIGVKKVTIWRDPVGPETTATNGLVYIADAIVVPGARPDVEAAYPATPAAYRAGWGYLLLTNGLPSLTGPNGNGVFKFHAFAVDEEGNQTKIGTKTVTVDNKTSSKPFGTLDTPTPGAVISGSSYINYGWALTPQPDIIPIDGSTIWVGIDGVNFAHPIYNLNRIDIASGFPGYTNSAGGVGAYVLDTTKFANGMHNIGWLVYDNQNHGDGIGSRFFEIQNSSATGGDPLPAQDLAPLLRTARMRRPPVPAAGAPGFRTGYDLNRALSPIRAAGGGIFEPVQLNEMDRLELHLPAGQTWEAALRFGDERRSLPIGSTFDAEGGIFYWQLGAGFLGRFELEFTSDSATDAAGSLVIPIDIITRP